jgi:hypothetical protein
MGQINSRMTFSVRRGGPALGSRGLPPPVKRNPHPFLRAAASRANGEEPVRVVDAADEVTRML